VDEDWEAERAEGGKRGDIDLDLVDGEDGGDGAGADDGEEDGVGADAGRDLE
jgi:hypothetical protein